jgi:hypothetical protein
VPTGTASELPLSAAVGDSRGSFRKLGSGGDQGSLLLAKSLSTGAGRGGGESYWRSDAVSRGASARGASSRGASGARASCGGAS